MQGDRQEAKDNCIPWDPIPRERSTFFDMSVYHLEEPPLGLPKLRIVLADATGEIWRLVFAGVIAYRKRFYPDWIKNYPLRPQDRSLGMWEVVNSSWYREAVSPNYLDPKRHFVISSEYDLYEVLADACTAHLLTQEERSPYDQPLPADDS